MNTYCIKHYHSADGHETIIEPEVDYNYCKIYLRELRLMWEKMGGLKIKITRTRIEAKGATYNMAAYFEKNKT